MTLFDFELDHDRGDRCGFGEVVYAESKTPAQVVAIVRELLAKGDVVLTTRANADHAFALKAEFGEEVLWFERARLLLIDRREGPVHIASTDLDALLDPETDGGGSGFVAVCCAGTSDLPVAEEAALTARAMGSRTALITDVGVAGVHRVLHHNETLRRARAIVVVAGMEGALPSLIAGLVDVPVIGVPTSVGYGASLGGIAALLGMLNSCAGGVSVVNIDNGFGAGQIADRINRPPARLAE